MLNETLKLIDKVVNQNEVNSVNFYFDLTKTISDLYKNFSIGIFFIENNGCATKSLINKNKINKYNLNEKYFKEIINNQKINFEIKTEEDIFLKKYTYVVKLAIKNSIFGFCILSSDNTINNDIKQSFKSIVSIISYKIKDYELNEVFKIQLKALQDNILEKENAYEVIKKQHKKLEELDKAKNLFLANISHELRTPLNAIIGFSQALDSKIFGELNEKQAEYIKDIQISGLHLLGMINEILDISKLEANAMKFSPVELDPTQVIQEVVNILEPLYKNKNITINFESIFKGKIKADYQKFQQILYNLLSNAIKFTPKDGKIKILSASNNKNYILKIKDNGIGIEKKYHNKIFKKFVHLNNVYTKNQNSTGLGLTITKELVKLHNGKITLESEPNKGTTFTMEFKRIIL